MKYYAAKKSFLSNRNLLGQLVRSLIAGGTASLVDLSVFSLSVNVFRINYIISNTLSFALGLIVNYILNREWVFNKEVHNTGRDFLIFSLIGVFGLVLSNILLFVFIDLKLIYFFVGFSSDSFANSASKVFVILLVFIWNFTARKKLIFSPAEQ